MERRAPSPSPSQTPAAQVRSSVVRARAAKPEPVVADTVYIPSGATLLNCGLSDTPWGGYGLGKVVNLIGDSSSGKTLLALTGLAEMCKDPRWDDYDLILDDAEDALAFDVAHLFGPKLAARLDTSYRSATVEEFYGNIKARLNGGKKKPKAKKGAKIQKDDDEEAPNTVARPFVYILDSLDALSSITEQERADTYAEGKEVSGAYKMEKAKLLTELLRVITGDVADSDSLVIIISQTRDNLDPMSFVKKTRSGGKALKFYSCHEIWLALGKKFMKGPEGRQRVIGVETHGKITKNKLTGKQRDCRFNIFYDYGVDDIGSCIDFLVAEGYWSASGQKISGLGLEGTRDKLIRAIEAQGLEDDLKAEVGGAWLDIEERLKLNRKPRFE